VLNMIKAVLFDLDGTLLDRDASVKRFIHCQYDRLDRIVGHIPREDYVARFMGQGDGSTGIGINRKP
jgi:putative hydrolase of the HAD superfamily